MYRKLACLAVLPLLAGCAWRLNDTTTIAASPTGFVYDSPKQTVSENIYMLPDNRVQMETTYVSKTGEVPKVDITADNPTTASIRVKKVFERVPWMGEPVTPRYQKRAVAPEPTYCAPGMPCYNPRYN